MNPRKRKAHLRAEGDDGQTILGEWDPQTGLLKVWVARQRSKLALTVSLRELLDRQVGQLTFRFPQQK
jgi:hypothetical protein